MGRRRDQGKRSSGGKDAVGARQIIRSPQSELDVTEIALYIARDNPDAAFRLLDRFDQTLKMLARNPGAGQSREDLAPNLRSFPVGMYLLFYRPARDGIELARILHGARDIRRFFFHG